MNSVRQSLVANFLGKGWIAFIGLVFVPVYINYMGIESYGLVGFGTAMFAVFSLLDMGFSTTLNRELARYSALPERDQEMRDFLKTLQSIYWIGAVLTAAIVISLAAPIARYWLNAVELPAIVIERVIMLVGIVIASQMLIGFYTGGLLGLRKHILSNAVNSGLATVRNGGAVLVLWIISPTITAFFIWYAICGVIGVIVLARIIWRSLPQASRRAKVRADLLFSVIRFAGGLSATSVVGLLLSQTDKLILSKCLSLEMLGYYTLAGTVASVLHYLGNPIFTAYFPSFTQLFNQGEIGGLSRQYHKATQILAVVVFPVAGVMVFFPRELILLWTNNADAVLNTYQLVSLLAFGTTMNVLASIPYGLQLAHGWTRLGFMVNSAAAVVLVPVLFLVIPVLGALGAGIVFVALNAGYILVHVQLMHQKILPQEKWRWYFRDVTPPAVAIIAVAVTVSGLADGLELHLKGFPHLAAVYVVMVMSAFLSVPEFRSAILQYGKRIRT